MKKKTIIFSFVLVLILLLYSCGEEQKKSTIQNEEPMEEGSGEEVENAVDFDAKEYEKLHPELISLEDPEKEIIFKDPIFEVAVRKMYELGNKKIKWKDIGYRTEFVLGTEDENYPSPFFYFDLSEFFDEGINGQTHIQSLDDLKWFTNLEALSISNWSAYWYWRDKEIDISFLSDLVNLKYIYFEEFTPLGDSKIFANLKNLEEVRLGVSYLTGNLSDFTNCENLKVLDVSFSEMTGDLSVLTSLKNLEWIDLMGAPITGNLSDLKNMKKLRAIHLEETKIVGDVSNLSGLSELEIVCLSETAVTGDVSSFSKLENLFTLYLDETEVGGNLSSLEDFRLSWGYFDNSNITGSLQTKNGFVEPRHEN